MIVTFRPQATLADSQLSLKTKALGFAQHFTALSSARNRNTGLVKHPTKTTKELIDLLKADPMVESAEPDYIRWFKSVPNDTRFSDMWGLQNTGQTVNSVAGTAGDDVKFVPAWDLARVSSTQVVVGVIDSGVSYLHPDLIGNMWTNPGENPNNSTDDDHNGYVNDYYGYDFLGGNSNPYDSGFHGTHVAGTIAAAGNNALGVIGVANRAKIMALKVSLDGESISSSATIAALQYATMMKGKGVNIVALNASYGGGGYSGTESAAIQAAGNAGIVFCAAAGNDTSNNDVNPTYPANYRLSNMIVVAASDQKDALATFSNYGASTVDIAAPGTNIVSTKGSVSITVGSTTYHSDPFVYTGFTAGMTKPVIDCNYGAATDFPASVKGNIALIQRGPIGANAIFFSDKVNNAKKAGAVAVIIYNHSPGVISGTLQAAGDWLPALAILQDDGLAIKAALPASATLTVTGEYQYLDGTSMATPHVTAAVAFAAMNFPKDTVANRINRILQNADPVAALQGKVATGGRLNLKRIVDANANGTPDWLETPLTGAPTITTSASLPAADSSTVYSQSFAATGGSGSSYTWAVVNGALPKGLSLSANGVLSGIASEAGSSTFVVEATDSQGNFGDKQFTMSVVVRPFTLQTPQALADATAASDYHQALVGDGGVIPYNWTVTSGSLPPGLALSAAGQITGFATTTGSFTFTAQATDAAGTSAQRDFSINVGSAQMTIDNGPLLPPGTRSLHYGLQLTATGGTGTLTWTVASGTLPAGLTLSTGGNLSGIPTTAVVSNLVLHVADSSGKTSNSAVTLAVDSTAFALTSFTSLLTGVKDLAYSQTLTATGGAAPYSWALGSAPLPDGLTLDSTGNITGTPTAPGTFVFSITATDHRARSLSQNYTIIIEAIPIAITSPLPLLYGVKGVPYSQAIQLSGGVQPFHWSIGAGTLPPGLRLGTTGVISGTPTTPGNAFSFTLSVTDNNGLSFNQLLQINISATFTRPTVTPPVFNTTTVGVPFTYNLVASDYPRSFSVTGLPPGITYNTTTGAISGRPTTGGNYTVTVKATNPAGTSPAVTAPFTVNGLPTGMVGTFTGIVGRDPTANGNLSSRFSITTTTTGSYTGSVTTGGTVKSIIGYLAASAPQLTATVGTNTLVVTFAPAEDSLSGTLGAAVVNAWRQTWSNTHLATSHAGYYSVGLNLTDAPDKADATVPHGSGYATFTIGSTGTLVVAGHAADGTAFTSATIIGPGGEIPVYSPMYSNLGSITGRLTVTDSGASPPTDNVASGTLTWLKPAIKSRVYPAKFGPTNLSAYGKYLALRSTGLTILGLPDAGLCNLAFEDGGIGDSSVNPNVPGFTFTSAMTVTMPTAGSSANPGKTTLTINRNTGAVSGAFTLVEHAPALVRTVNFYGSIVRPVSGTTKAEGYFLLPKIPTPPQTSSTSPVLSGKFYITP